MKKFLIEKTKEQKKVKKSNSSGKTVLKIVVCIAISCAVLFCAVLLGMDALMRAAAPDIYLGNRLLNTYEQLKKEKNQNSGFFNGEALPKGDLDAEISGNFEKIGFSLNGGFNRDSKKTYLKGEVDTFKGKYNAELFYNNGISGICLPDFLDVWLCTQNNSLFDDMQSTGINEKLGIPYIPSADFGKVSFSAGNIYPSLKALVSNIKISDYSKKGNGLSEYTVTVSGDALKNVMLAISDSLWKENFANEAADMNLLKTYISEIPFPEKAQFTICERKNAVVYASSRLLRDGEELEIHIDMSKKARLSDSVEIRVLHTMDGTNYGFTYNSDGEYANPKGKNSDNTELSLMLPFFEKISFKRNIDFDDNKNFSYTLGADSDGAFEFSINGNGVYTASELDLTADYITFKTADAQHTGSGTAKFTSNSSGFEVPKREQFELSTIPQDTLKRLTDGISLFLN